MADKPEAVFRRAVERHLSPSVHVEGMANPYRSGTPDRYYEGPGGVLWVEYKWIEKLPRKYTPALTARQKQWLHRAYGNDVPVAVITGSPRGGWIWFGLEWDTTHTQEHMEETIKTRKELAEILDTYLSWRKVA